MPGYGDNSCLRESIMAATAHCPLNLMEVRCPFFLLGLLGFHSRKQIIDDLDHAALLKLFDLIPGCRCPVDPRTNVAPAPGIETSTRPPELPSKIVGEERKT